jgi:hypothetical protein
MTLVLAFAVYCPKLFINVDSGQYQLRFVIVGFTELMIISCYLID